MAKDVERNSSESITYDSGNHEGPPDLRFIHYNDVYHVEPGSQEPVGGIARFRTLCQHYQHSDDFKGQSDAITFFSGDAFNPSLESSITKGKHMVPVLNSIETTVACLGNHDLDFGIQQFESLSAKCDFPWLCANVLDPSLGGQPIGHCKPTVMLTSSNGLKIGVIGLVEREWLDTINSLPPNLEYHSASATAARLAPKLREQGAEMIVVVSHQREPNDKKLASKLPLGTIDVVLGGHDHYYRHEIVNGTHIIRSGSDFKQLSYLEARKRKGTNFWDFNIIRRDVYSGIAEDSASIAMVSELSKALESKLQQPIGHISAPLDARFTTVRLKESNYGNFVCDLMRFHYEADCAIMAGGTMRGDQIYPPGLLKMKDLMTCFPFEDPCVVISVKGKHLLRALENGVSKYPALEGRFPQVSGIQFTFDANKDEGSRCSEVLVKGKSLELEKDYIVATRDYMVRGKDGFTSMMLDEEGGPAKSIVSEENGLLISMILRQYFLSLKVFGFWTRVGRSLQPHWDGIQKNLHEVHPVRQPAAPAESHQLNGSSHLSDTSMVKGVSTTTAKRKRQSLDPIRTSKQPKGSSDNHYVDESDSDEERCYSAGTRVDRWNLSDEELTIARMTMTKWRRLARLKGQATLCEGGKHFVVDWTKSPAPKIEGRIVILNEVEH